MRKDYTIGQIIVFIRKHLGLSRKEFAARLGISANTLGRYERDETVPSCVFLIRLKHEFDINIDVFQPNTPTPRLFSKEFTFSEKQQRDSYILENETPVLFPTSKRNQYKINQTRYIKEIKSLFYQFLESLELKKLIKEKCADTNQR